MEANYPYDIKNQRGANNDLLKEMRFVVLPEDSCGPENIIGENYTNVPVN